VPFGGDDDRRRWGWRHAERCPEVDGGGWRIIG
jgi:hypothetical protein